MVLQMRSRHFLGLGLDCHSLIQFLGPAGNLDWNQIVGYLSLCAGFLLSKTTLLIVGI
jgi:hypothetical protein